MAGIGHDNLVLVNYIATSYSYATIYWLPVSKDGVYLLLKSSSLLISITYNNYSYIRSISYLENKVANITCYITFENNSAIL